MSRILFISHSPAITTGYGRVARRIAHGLQEAGHQIVAVASGHTGGKHELPYLLIPMGTEFDSKTVARAIRDHRPDILLTIGDPWMFDFLPSLAERRLVRWIAYFPVDGFPLPVAWKQWVQDVDSPIVFSRFTQNVVAEATGKAPKLVYHGVNTARFRPLGKSQAKRTANVQDHFVVGTVARNQERKNLPALIRAFATFAANKPDVLLYLHTQVQGDWDLSVLSRRFGIEDKTRVTAGLGAGSGVPDETLATIYNAMDVFVLPTMAEGFGLPIMEAQACGVPVLATDFSACPELLPDPIQRLRVKDTLIMRGNFEQAIVDVDDIVAKLEYFYHHHDELKALGERCHQFAQKFEWADACAQFVQLVAEIDTENNGHAVDVPSPLSQGQQATEHRPPSSSLPEVFIFSDVSGVFGQSHFSHDSLLGKCNSSMMASEERAGAPKPLEAAEPTERACGKAKVFNYFDRAYVLNLDSDRDRFAHVTSRLQRLGIEFERFAALLPPAKLASNDPRFTAAQYAAHHASALSHRAILQTIWDRGENFALIFEDDVVLRDDTNLQMQKIVPQLQSHPWDIFYLGLHLHRGSGWRSENLLRVRQGFHTHAYAVKREAIPRLIATIDKVLAAQAGTFDGFEDKSLRKLCAMPLLAVQEPNTSHTASGPNNRLNQYFEAFDGEEFLKHCPELQRLLSGHTAEMPTQLDRAEV